MSITISLSLLIDVVGELRACIAKEEVGEVLDSTALSELIERIKKEIDDQRGSDGNQGN